MAQVCGHHADLSVESQRVFSVVWRRSLCLHVVRHRWACDFLYRLLLPPFGSMWEKPLVALTVLLTRSLEPSRQPWPLYTTPACECECVIKVPGANEKEVPPAAELSPHQRRLAIVLLLLSHIGYW